MAITCTPATGVTIVTGYTAATPCTFTDIVNADIAAGWGIWTSQCSNQFCTSGSLIIGDGVTNSYFADIEKSLILTKTSSHISFIQVRTNGNFRIGEVFDTTKKTSGKGCTIMGVAQSNSNHLISNYASEPNGKIEIYSSCLLDLGTTLGCSILINSGNFYIWNSELSGLNIYMLHATSICQLYNFTMSGSRNEGGIFYSTTINTFDNLEVMEAANGALAAGANDNGDYTVKNLRGVGCSYAVYFWSAQTRDGYLINPDLDNWLFRWSTATGKVYRQYEFDLHVQKSDKTNFTSRPITIWQKAGSNNFVDSDKLYTGNTDASGNIPTQTLTWGYYDSAHGNTLQQYYHKILIEGDSDHLDYETEFNPDEKTKENITMVDVSDIVAGINDIKGTGFVKDTDSLTDFEAKLFKLIPFL